MSIPMPVSTPTTTVPARAITAASGADDAPGGADVSQDFGRQLDSARNQGRQQDTSSASTPSPSPSPSPASSDAAASNAASDGKGAKAAHKDDSKRSGKDKSKSNHDTPTLATSLLTLIGAAPQAAPAATSQGTTTATATSAGASAGLLATALTGGMPATAIGSAAALGDGANALAQADGAGTDTTAGTAVAASGGGANLLSAALNAAVQAMASGTTGAAAAPDGAATGKGQPQNLDPASLGAVASGLQGLSQAGAAATAHALTVASPVGSPSFPQELGQQVVWLSGQDVKQATIRLHPKDLGALDVKVSLAHDNRVNVSFAAQHPAAVTAVQQTLGQLDMMLAGQGLSLGQAHVGQQGDGQRDGASPRGEASGEADAVAEVSGPSISRATALGLLDTFA